jgi:type I restriction enzyme S subunit
MIGSIGETYLEKNDAIPYAIKNVGVFSCNDEYKAKWLYYYLISPYSKTFIRNYLAGAVQKFLPLGTLREFPVIPYDEQKKKIVDLLYSIDVKIELNNKINTKLEAMAKMLYDYWFVQFDFPDENGKPYKSSGGKMVWNDELKREIPEGWNVKKLEDCIETIIDYRGKTPKKLGRDWSDNPNDILALSAKHVKNGQLVNLKDANRVDNDLYNTWMKKELREGDILLTSEAPCGEFFYLIGKTKFCLSQRLFAIRTNNEMVAHSYLYYELSSGNGNSQILGKVSGSTVFGIRQDELRTVNILIPNQSWQKMFSEIVEPIYQKIRNNDYQNQQLSILRDWLLPMLMNGQVKINQYEKTQ